MAFKLVVLTAILAYANAGFLGAPAVATYSAAPAVSTSYIHQAAPVAVAHAAPVLSTYASSPVAIHAPSVGASHQSVERSLGGAQSVSHYSKAVDSAFSSVRKYDTRITNDALSVAHAPVLSAYSAPYVTKSVGPVVSTYASHGPIVSSYSAPVATYSTHGAPVVSAYSAAPVVAKAAVAYSPAAVVSHATFTGLGTAYQW